MDSEVKKLYPETQVIPIELSYPKGHTVYARPLGFKAILLIGETLKDSLLSFSDKANEEKVVLSFILEQTPEVIQKILRLAYGDEKIEVGALYAEEVIGLLMTILEQNEGLKKRAMGFFDLFGGAGKILALLQPKSSPVLSRTDIPSSESLKVTPSTKP